MGPPVLARLTAQICRSVLAIPFHFGQSARVSDAIVEDANGWSLVREERRIDQIQLDFRFGLVLDDGTLIVIESPFVATIDGVATEVVPETLQRVEPALAVLHRQLSQVRAFRSGALQIVLTDGGRIEVPPGDGYENWDVILPDGSQFIGLPDGDVATFPPKL